MSTPDHILFGRTLCSCFRCQVKLEQELTIIRRQMMFGVVHPADTVNYYGR